MSELSETQQAYAEFVGDDSPDAALKRTHDWDGFHRGRLEAVRERIAELESLPADQKCDREKEKAEREATKLDQQIAELERKRDEARARAREAIKPKAKRRQLRDDIGRHLAGATAWIIRHHLGDKLRELGFIADEKG